MKTFNRMSMISAVLVSVATLGAGAANASEQIKISDLQLSVPADAAVFKARLERAAGALCARQGPVDLSTAAACRQGVREEALEQLTPDQRIALTSPKASVKVATGPITSTAR